MSYLSRITRDALRNGRQARFSNYAPGVSTERINKWMSSLSQRATTNESRGYITQLGSLISFFNREADKNVQAIDWASWKNEIATPGLVERLQKNYQDLSKEQYNVEGISKGLVQGRSKEIIDLESELIYHAALWSNVYADYTLFLFELEEYGNAGDYLMHENYDFFQGLEAELEELTETHNYLAGSKDDLNLRGYLACQFSWGKKVVSFYRHPADDFKCARATKNILGR